MCSGLVSGQAGLVLTTCAHAHFCEVVQIRTSKLSHLFTEKLVNVSTISFYSVTIIATKLVLPAVDARSLFHMRNLKSLASFLRPSSLTSFVVHSASNGSWVGAQEQDYSFSTQSESESCLPMITAKKQSSSECFAAGACLPDVAATCTKLHAICNHYLTESMWSNYWNFCLLRSAEHMRFWGIKIASCSDFLASNLTKYSWESMPPDTPWYYMPYVDLATVHLQLPCYSPALNLGTGAAVAVTGDISFDNRSKCWFEK